MKETSGKKFRVVLRSGKSSTSLEIIYMQHNVNVNRLMDLDDEANVPTNVKLIIPQAHLSHSCHYCSGGSWIINYVTFSVSLWFLMSGSFLRVMVVTLCHGCHIYHTPNRQYPAPYTLYLFYSRYICR